MIRRGALGSLGSVEIFLASGAEFRAVRCGLSGSFCKNKNLGCRAKDAKKNSRISFERAETVIKELVIILNLRVPRDM